MKKIISVLVITLLIISAFSITVFAEDLDVSANTQVETNSTPTAFERLIAEGVFNNNNRALYFTMASILVIISYIVGSLNAAIVICKLSGLEDVRKFGSGNAGATNMKRVYGTKYFCLTLLFDALKGAVVSFIALVIFPLDWVAYLCGLACLLGHAFPIFFRFKGGKCVSTTMGIVFVLNPLVGFICILLFISIIGIFRKVSVSSMTTSIVFAILNMLVPFISPSDSHPIKVIVTAIIPVLIIWLHRSNIKKLIAGTESNFEIHKNK